MSALNTTSRTASKANLLPISGFRDPLSLPGLINWLDFSSTQYLSTATNGIGTVSNGSAIAYCFDRSGSGYNATQATLANRPTWSSAGLNSLGAASFDGTNDLLTTSSITPLVGNFILTAFCVSTRSSTSFGSQFSIGTSADGIGLADGHGGLTRAYSPGNGSAFRMTYSATITGQVHTICKYASNSNAFIIRRNGSLPVSIGNDRVDIFNSSYSSAAVSIGLGILNVTNYHSGLISEWILYSRALTLAEILTVERYLGAKWNITVS
jgi:hypothetical protein